MLSYKLSVFCRTNTPDDYIKGVGSSMKIDLALSKDVSLENTGFFMYYRGLKHLLF